MSTREIMGHFTKAAANAAIATTARSIAATGIWTGTLDEIVRIATMESILSVAEGFAALALAAAGPWQSSDAYARTRTEEWKQSVRDRMRSQSFAERLPLP